MFGAMCLVYRYVVVCRALWDMLWFAEHYRVCCSLWYVLHVYCRVCFCSL